MKWNPFKEVSNDEMFEMYKDIIGSKELEIRPKTLDQYVKTLVEHFSLSSFSDGIEMTQKLFYDEIAVRYFKQIEIN